MIVVNSDQLYTYVGHLMVTFDARGRLISIDPRSGPIATTPEAVAALEKVVGKKLTTPSRVKSLKAQRADGMVDVLVENYQAVGDLSRTFTLVTNDFLLTGGDGYQSLMAASVARGAQRPETGERTTLACVYQERPERQGGPDRAAEQRPGGPGGCGVKT